MNRTPDIWAVLPVKEIGDAKSRLAAAYSPSFRRGFARAMVQDVLGALVEVPELTGIVVVTVDPDAAELARRHGAELFEDGARDGHTGAVMAAIRRFVREGRGGVLTVPGDIPFIAPDEVSRLIAAHAASPAFSIVPAHDRRGSNAILMTPADVVPLAFGNDSFYPHLEAARGCGIEPTILPMPGIGLDIDNPEDLALLLRQKPRPTHAWNYLVAAGLVESEQCEQAELKVPQS
jgi:2-phospho-L-lactate guanylyltransferase